MLSLVKLCVVVQVICIILSVIMMSVITFSVTITSAVMLSGVILSDIIAQTVGTLWPVLQKYFDHHEWCQYYERALALHSAIK